MSKQITLGTWWMWYWSFGNMYIGPVEVVKVTKAQIRLTKRSPASGYRHVLELSAAEYMHATAEGAQAAAAAWLRLRAESLRAEAQEAEKVADEVEAAHGAARGRGWEVLS